MDDSAIFQKLYSTDDEILVYARLKNRLSDDINKALVASALRQKEFEDWYFFLVFKYYNQKNRHEIAYYYLKKALKKAEESNNYDLVVILYQNLLRSVRYHQHEDYGRLKEKLLTYENYSFLLRKLEFQCAHFEEQLRQSQNLLTDSKINLREALQLIKKTEKLKPLPNRLKLLYLKLKSLYYIILRNYDRVIEILIPEEKSTLAQNFDDLQDKDLQVNLMIFLINALTIENKFEKVMQLTPHLHKMIEKNEVLRARYIFFYYQSLISSFCKLEKYEEALKLIRIIESEENLAVNPQYWLYASLNKAICLYETGCWHEALRAVARLKTQETYNHIDVRIKARIDLSEILLRILFGDMDFAFQMCRSLEKEDYLTDMADKAMLQHLKKISNMNFKDMIVYLTKLALSDEVIENYSDKQIINYKKWIQKFIQSIKE